MSIQGTVLHDTIGPLSKRQNQPRKLQCSVCNDLQIECGKERLGRFDETLQASRDGCASCTVLTNVINAFAKRHEVATITTWEVRVRELYSDLIFLGDGFPRNVLGSMNLYTTTSLTSPLPVPRNVRCPSLNTESDKAFELLRGWLKECSASHEGCKRLLKPSMLPTRIIEIVGPSRIRLRQTELEEDLYICLSHCWGKHPVVRTTKATLAQHLDSIDWDDLPKTFQDAVEITSRLGLKYIWIDSLCIVQDDLDDWRREGSKMCDIYSQSYLTIAAAKSEDSTGGCYSIADVGSIHWLTTPNNEPYDLHVCEEITHPDDSDFDLTPILFPLLTRSWVVQERFLSPRMIHFGSAELFWECREGHVCECSDWRRVTDPDWLDWKEHPSQRLFTTGTETDLGKVWRHTVREYSSKQLTFENDIFPALQGIAKSLADGRDYHAGFLVTDDLVLDLLWTNHESTRPTVWRAPTWSWASLKGPIFFDTEYLDRNDIETLASIVNIHTTPLGPDRFGQITSGELQLKGPCGEARCKKDIETKRWHLRARSEAHDSFSLTLREAGDLSYFRFDCGDELHEDQVVTVMIITNETSVMRGLVFSCVDSEQDIYKRVGLVQIRTERRASEWVGADVQRTLTII